MRALALAVLVTAQLASAQPSQTPPATTTPVAPVAPAAPVEPTTPATPGQALLEGNAAAIAGDWGRVTQLIEPLLGAQLPRPDLAEAHRLAGLAAFFRDRRPEAEAHFLAYLRIDLDGQLDPALYPPEVVSFFNDVKAKHGAELRTRRPKAKRYWVLNLLPPWGQFQNGDRVKGLVVGGMLAGFVVANATSFFVLRSWCTRVSGEGGHSLTCDDGKDRSSSAAQLRAINIVTGVGAILTYAYGVVDGVSGYRRRTSERSMQPVITTTSSSAFVGVAGTF